MKDETAVRSRFSRAKRLRAHVDYNDMSVSYGRVKLAVPTGFKEMLETVTREILREQPTDIPLYLATYFQYLKENQKKGIKTATLVTERIVEVKKTTDTATQDEVEETQPIVTQSGTCQTDDLNVKSQSVVNEEDCRPFLPKIRLIQSARQLKRIKLPKSYRPIHNQMSPMNWKTKLELKVKVKHQ